MASAMNEPGGNAAPKPCARGLPQRHAQPAQPETGPPTTAHANQKKT